MFELFKLIGLGLVLLLPLVNPLTTVALFLGLSGDMSEQEKKKQSAMAAFYVFVIMMVAWYAGKADHQRRSGHRFRAAGQHQPSVAGFDAARRYRQRVQTRTAQAVPTDAATPPDNALWRPGRESCD